MFKKYLLLITTITLIVDYPTSCSSDDPEEEVVNAYIAARLSDETTEKFAQKIVKYYQELRVKRPAKSQKVYDHRSEPKKATKESQEKKQNPEKILNVKAEPANVVAAEPTPETVAAVKPGPVVTSSSSEKFWDFVHKHCGCK